MFEYVPLQSMYETKIQPTSLHCDTYSIGNTCRRFDSLKTTNFVFSTRICCVCFFFSFNCQYISHKRERQNNFSSATGHNLSNWINCYWTISINISRLLM